ncbi:unnamed protein product [Arctogadus glacialis]
MAALYPSHFPTEQDSINDENTGSGGIVGICQSECNPTQTDTTTSGNISDCFSGQQDAQASSDSANNVSLAESDGKPQAGTREDPLDNLASEKMASVDSPSHTKPRLPVSGTEGRDDDVKDDECDRKDNFTKHMVQPRKLANDTSDADGEKIDPNNYIDEKSHENDALNGLEVDINRREGIGNSVDSMPGYKIGPKGKRIRSSLQCKDCGKRFNRRETLNLHRHFHSHNDPAPLTCKECGLTFQDRSSFVKHRKEHKEKEQPLISSNKDSASSEGRRFTCANCKTLFSTVEELRGHNCSKYPDKPYRCPLCGREFQFKVAIPRHMQIHSLENIFQCQECNKHFSDGPAFRAHQRCHAALKPYECLECGMVFKHYSVMEDHRRKHTENMPSHHCSVCGKTFKYSSLLHQHQYLHTGQKPFCCPECGKKFAFAQNLKAHYRQHRLSTTTYLVPPDKPSKQDPVPTTEPANGLGKENTGQSIKPRRVYNCPLCPLKFTIPANLRAHMLIHEAEYEKLDNTPTKETKPMISEKGYNCPQCPSIFHNKLSYYGHLLKAHRSESHYLEQVTADQSQLRRRIECRSKLHKCPQCSKMFHQRSVFEAHMRVHSKEKPYQCNVCGKLFRCNSYLRQHLIIHTGEKPHKCPDCGKEFAFLQNMKTHLKLHQAKPFRCGSCHNFYSDAAQLKQHMLSHKRPKRHKCQFCDKSFTLACLLRDHINTHNGARPHCCAVCHKSFSWLSSLNVHMKRHERRLASGPVSSSAMVAPPTPRDTDGGQNAFQTQAPRLAAQIETKQAEQCLSESCPPVQWKVDGGEVLPVLLARKSDQPQVLTQFDVSMQHHYSPLKSLSNPSSVQSLKTSSIAKESSVLISGSLQTAMPQTVSPSLDSEVEKQRQAQPEKWRGTCTSTVMDSNSSSLHHVPLSSAYADRAALWSVKPNPVTSSSQVFPSKQESSTSPTKDDFNPHIAIPFTVSQSEKRVNGGVLPKQWSTSLAVSSSALLDQSKAVLSTPASPDVYSPLVDMQTATGIPKTSNPSDKWGVNPELQLQLKPGGSNLTSPQKVPMTLPYQPPHFAHGVGPAVWRFQTNHVGPQALLPGHFKPGNAQELQQKPMAVMSPQMPRTLPLPLSPHTGPHNLGGRLPLAPEGLLQCMICGHSLPCEFDLEMHYLQHAQGEI